MRKLTALLIALVAVLCTGLAAVPALADDPVILRDAYTVAGLPTCNTGEKYRIVMVSDGDDASDCTSGGGSSYAFCGCTGSAWQGLGSLLDFSGTHAAVTSAVVDAAGGADELTVAAGSSTFIGAVKLTGAAAPPVACAAGTVGTIYVDSDIAKACICNGTNYVLMNDDSTTTGCS
jgi:hypothetical protein